MNCPAEPVPFPGTGSSRTRQALRSACDPRSTGPGPLDAGIEPFGLLLEHAVVAKLTCLLADWLIRRDRPACLPRPVRHFLETQMRVNRHRWRLHHRETARVITALDARGIPAAAINGIACASLLYGGRGTREYTDADILIPDGTQGTAARILAGLGYVAAGPGTAALRRDLGDPVVPVIIVDLTSRLAHADGPAAAAALARRVDAPSWTQAPEPLPVLARDDGFTHILARLASRARWAGLADAIRYALSSDGPPAASASSPPAAAAAGWELVRQCWPELPVRPPLTGSAPETP